MPARHHALVATLAVALVAPIVRAQFGGTGADGALRPTSDIVLDTTTRPEGWSFTSIDVPLDVRVRLIGSHPAILRSRGAVRIAGSLVADGFASISPTEPGAGGPGGYAGGTPGAAGRGPAGGRGGLQNRLFTEFPHPGGHATPGIFMAQPVTGTYGRDWPFDLRGGSGSGGLFSQIDPANHGSGSGGGGVIALLADGPIEIDGAVTADGPAFASGAGGAVFIRTAQAMTIRGRVTATGFQSWLIAAGQGRVRLDAWAERPVLAPTADVRPEPRRVFLPALATADTPLGWPWYLTAESVPGDDVAFFMSLGGASIPLPGLGLLELDPTAGLFELGVGRVAATGVEPNATIAIPVPNDPGLRGLRLHAQAIAFRTSAPAGPRLTQGVSVVLR